MRRGAMCCRTRVKDRCSTSQRWRRLRSGSDHHSLKASETVLIAFVGDVHGCVLHAMSAVLALEHHEGRRLDAVVQVGDFGAFPSVDRLQPVDREYLTSSPAQADVFPPASS